MPRAERSPICYDFVRLGHSGEVLPVHFDLELNSKGRPLL
jgi:hypothetical protein